MKVAAAAEQARLSRPIALPVSWRHRPLTAVVLVVVAVAIWGAQAAVWNPPARAINDRDRDAGLRYTIAMQVARVERFRARTHRLPTSLGEVGESFRGMSYVRTDSARYRLTGADDRLVLTYRSDSSLRTFLGGSLLSIRERKRP